MALSDLIGQFLVWALGAIFISFIATIVAVGLWFLWKYLKYKIKVTIYEKVGNAYMVHDNKAFEQIQPGSDGKRQRKIVLQKKFKGIKKGVLPSSITFLPMNRGKMLNMVYRDGLMMPLPLREENEPELVSTTEDVLRVLESWDSDYVDNVETHKKPAGFLEKYGGYIVPFTVMFFNFILWLVLLSQINGGGGGGFQVIP